jgi:hypothetical protein
MAANNGLARTPFYFLGRRPYCEARLAAHLRREHRRGRSLDAIMRDPYVDQCGGESVLRAVLRHAELIRALSDDVAAAISQSKPVRWR